MSVEVIQLSEDFMKEFYEENPEFKNMDMSGWCECEMESDPLFHDDGITPMDNCVDKHHYHCGWCLICWRTTHCLMETKKPVNILSSHMLKTMKEVTV